MTAYSKEMEAIFFVLVDKYACDLSKLSESSIINRELGIEGDDASELIGFLEARLGRSISINMSKYFTGEGLFQFRKTEDLSIGLLTELIAKC